MKVEQQQIGTVDVLKPTGALVDEDAEQFLKTLNQRLRSPNPRVVVAMQEVPYVDSAALDGLLSATEAMQDYAMSLKLAAVSPTCREILELTGLSGRFRLFKNVEDAVKSFL